MNDERRLEELEANARYARNRFRLYRARAYGSQPTDRAKLRELERDAELAERLLAQALSQDA
jgi:hypothetical protein